MFGNIWYSFIAWAAQLAAGGNCPDAGAIVRKNKLRNVRMVPRQSIKRTLARALLIALATLFATFAADDARVRLIHAPLRTVNVKRYLAIPQKGGKFQFVFDGTEVRPCVNALFPHQGNQPCWYLNRHKTERIDM
jgi:hypothetical protein